MGSPHPDLFLFFRDGDQAPGLRPPCGEQCDLLILRRVFILLPPFQAQVRQFGKPLLRCSHNVFFITAFLELRSPAPVFDELHPEGVIDGVSLFLVTKHTPLS